MTFFVIRELFSHLKARRLFTQDSMCSLLLLSVIGGRASSVALILVSQMFRWDPYNTFRQVEALVTDQVDMVE